jgi:hypothetical protein
MKKMISCCALIMMTLFAQAQIRIIGAEYFWDTDPGQGNGTAIATGSLVDSININSTINIPANLAAGWHKLFVRTRMDSANLKKVWGLTTELNVLVAFSERIEYFWDNDPGLGNGTVLSNGNTGIDTFNVNYNIPTTGVLPGLHKLYIRRYNPGNAFISHALGVDVKVSNGIIDGEYFLDTDPGVGNGFKFSTAATGDSINKAPLSLPVGCVAPGTYRVYARFRDEAGLWSMADSVTTVTIVPPTPAIVQANPGPGPNGTPFKLKGTGSLAPYRFRAGNSGAFSNDSIYLVPNGTSVGYQMRDSCTNIVGATLTAPAAPTTYVGANSNASLSFEGWRHPVFVRNASNQIMLSLADNNLWLGNVNVNTYFASTNVATGWDNNRYLKRSFRVQAAQNPTGNKTVRLYISKAEYNDLAAADPTITGTGSLVVTKYTGSNEDSAYNPMPGSNSMVIPNNLLSIADLGTHYSIEFNTPGFSSFYVSATQTNLNPCPGSNIELASSVVGSTYQWQVNTGSGYTNLSNGSNYGNVTSQSLQITNVPGTFSNYQYRCVVNGTPSTQIFKLTIGNQWTGAVSTAWENPANWSCGALPTTETDVVISAGRARYPVVGSNVSIRSLTIKNGAQVNVGTGFKLTILK